MRIYTINFTNVTINAAQDLFLVLPGTNKPVQLVEFGLWADAAAALAQARVTLRRFSAVVTNGSGGAAIATPTKLGASSDGAPGFTARTNDTVLATSSGTNEILKPFAFNVLNGLLYAPLPENRSLFLPGEACVLRLDTALTATVCDGYMDFAEF